jgi:hypothetical protein
VKYTKAAAVVVGSVMALGTGSSAFAADGKDAPAAPTRLMEGNMFQLKDQQPLGDRNPGDGPLNGVLDAAVQAMNGKKLNTREGVAEMARQVAAQRGQGSSPNEVLLGGLPLGG